MNNANSFAVRTDQLAERPQIFPHKLDLISDNLLVVEFSVAEVSATSFSDQCVPAQTSKGVWIPWHLLADIFKKLSRLNPTVLYTPP